MSISRVNDPRSALMLLSAIVEPGDADLDDLVAEVGPVEALARIWEGGVGDRLRRITAPAVAATGSARARADEITTASKACGARLLIPGDPEWPPQLEDLRHLCDADEPHLRPPRCLWVRGKRDLAEFSERAVAITGSRAATEYGKHLADDLAVDVADAGWTVVSGAALGIDAAAHAGALAREGSTIAVLAGGVDCAYPKPNRALLELIARRGLIVSEWAPRTPGMRWRFLARSRVLAALAAGTVVVEAGDRSGARTTARYAAELGRILMFTPGPVTSALSAGVHRIARAGWDARLVADGADVLDDLAYSAAPRTTAVPGAGRQPFAELGPVAQAVVEALPRGYLVDLERLAAAAGVPVDHAAEALTALRTAGWVVQVDGRWRLAPHPEAPRTGSGGHRPPADSQDAAVGQ